MPIVRRAPAVRTCVTGSPELWLAAVVPSLPRITVNVFPERVEQIIISVPTMIRKLPNEGKALPSATLNDVMLESIAEARVVVAALVSCSITGPPSKTTPREYQLPLHLERPDQ